MEKIFCLQVEYFKNELYASVAQSSFIRDRDQQNNQTQAHVDRNGKILGTRLP